MTRNLLWAAAAFAALLSASTRLAASEPSAPVPAWPVASPDLTPDPGVRWGTLSSGLRYAVIQHSEPPGRASMRLYVNAGSLMETEEQRGLAHFLEHMAFNGTTHHAQGSMVEYFQRLGMGFGNDTNAHTSWDETVYKLELPEVSDALLADTMQMLRDYADGILLEEKAIDDERGVILAEKRDRDSVQYRLFEDSFAFTLPDCLVSQRLPIGQEAVIKSVTRADFLSFYKGWYTPDRMVVAVVGDIDPDKAVSFIEKYFGDMSANPSPRAFPDLGKIAPRGVVAKVKIEPEASAVDLSIATARVLNVEPDSKATRAEALARDVANFIIGRRLDILSRGKDAPFTNGASYTFHIWNFVDTSEIDLSCPPERWQAALALAETEIRRALTHGFTRPEVAEAVASLRNRYEQNARRAPTFKSAEIVDTLLSAIGERQVFTSPEQDLELANPVLDAMTPETALAALRAAWEDDTRIVYVGGNLPADASDAQALAVFTESAAKPVEAPKAEESAEFAYRDFGRPGTPQDGHVLMDLGITQLRFANNVYANVKQTDFEKNVVRVTVRFGAGSLELPADKPGLTLLSQMVFASGGLQKHSADDIARIFAGKNVGVSFSAGPESFVLSGVTSTRDLEDELDLLAAYVTAPGYREEALVQARRQLPEIYRATAHTADGVLQDRVGAFLASGDFRFGLPPQAEVEKLEMADVAAWLAAPLAKGRMEVSIVGDVDPDEAVAILARTFGALPERGAAKPPFEKERILALPSPCEKTFTYESALPKAVSMLVWPTEDTWDVSRTRRLMVMAQILSDRLRVELREKMGEAYSPYAYTKPSDTYKGYGYAVCYSELAPDKVAEAAALVKACAAEMAEKGVTQDELDRALKPILQETVEWRRNNQYWLGNVLATSQEFPVRIEWARTMMPDLQSITVADIDKLAAQYLKAASAIDIRVMPQAPATPEASPAK
jgi:zinc protease